MTTKKMATAVAMVCVLAMTLAANVACGQPAQRACNTSSGELAGYTAYLRSQIPANVNKVILLRTRGYDIAASSWIGWAVEGRAVPQDVQKEFARRNAVTCPIHPFSGVPNLYFYTTDKNEGISTEAQFEKRFG